MKNDWSAVKGIWIVTVLGWLLMGCSQGGEAAQPPESAPTEAVGMGAMSDDADSQNASGEAAAATSSAAEASTVTVISVGVNAEFEPFVFMDENGTLAGFDIDLMNALAAVGGFEVSYVTTPFAGIFDKVASGDFDVAISAITITDQRKATVDFTDPYFTSGQAPVSYLSAGQGLAVRADDSSIQSDADLSPTVAVAVKDGTTGAAFVREQTEAQMAVFPEIEPALVALSDGAVDAIIADISVLADFIAENPTAGIKLVGGPVIEEEYGIAVSKESPAIYTVLNTALATIRRDGTYEKIFDKWFGSP